MAIQSFVLDPNATIPEDAPVAVRNNTGSSLAAGDLVYISGWDEANTRPEVSPAEADVAGKQAVLVMRASLATATGGEAFRAWRTAADQDTDGSTVGDPVYLSETAGEFTLTAPTAAGSVRQVVGRVAIVRLTVGVVEFDIVNSLLERVGSNELQDSAIAAAKIAATAVDNTKLGTTAAQDNLDALSDTSRKYVKTNPAVGEFPVISVHRQADGKLEAEYDDAPII